VSLDVVLSLGFHPQIGLKSFPVFLASTDAYRLGLVVVSAYWLPTNQKATAISYSGDSEACVINLQKRVACTSDVTDTKLPWHEFKGPAFKEVMQNQYKMICTLAESNKFSCTDWSLRNEMAPWNEVTPEMFPTMTIDDYFGCGLNPNGKLFCSPMYSIDWVEYSAPTGLKMISLSGDYLCGVNTAGEIFCTSEFENMKTSLQWFQIHGKALQQIDISGRRLCGTSHENEVWCLEDILETPSQPKFFRVTGQFKRVVLSESGSLLGINLASEVYFCAMSVFQQHLGNNDLETYVDESKPIVVPSLSIAIPVPLKENSSSALPYIIETKSCDQKPSSNLEIRYSGAPNDALKIWGAQCLRDNRPADTPTVRHTLTCRGDAHHAGTVRAREFCVGIHCMKSDLLQTLLDRLASLKLDQPPGPIKSVLLRNKRDYCDQCCYHCAYQVGF
jgi:hypothetical protein